jgi:YVTN family beta-propeller protein
VLPSATVGQHPALIARSPDGKSLYVTSGASRSLSVVSIANPAQPAMSASLDVGGYPHGVAVTPDGRYVVVATTTGKTLVVVDAKSNSVAATVNIGVDPNDVLIAGE